MAVKYISWKIDFLSLWCPTAMKSERAPSDCHTRLTRDQGTGVRQKGYFLSWCKKPDKLCPSWLHGLYLTHLKCQSLEGLNDARVPDLSLLWMILPPRKFCTCTQRRKYISSESAQQGADGSSVASAGGPGLNVDLTTYCPWNLDKLTHLSVPQFSHSLEENNDSFYFIDLL